MIDTNIKSPQNNENYLGEGILQNNMADEVEKLSAIYSAHFSHIHAPILYNVGAVILLFRIVSYSVYFIILRQHSFSLSGYLGVIRGWYRVFGGDTWGVPGIWGCYVGGTGYFGVIRGWYRVFGGDTWVVLGI